MKKFLALVLVLTMVLALGVTVSAEEAPTVTPEAVTLTKTYELTGGTAAPEEELSFTVTADEANLPVASGELVVGTENKVTTSGKETTEISVSFPTYNKVGVYKYTISENAGSTLGVEYDKDPLYVVVTVTNTAAGTGSEDALEVTVAVHRASEDGEKEWEIINKYGLGQLTVTKKVTGNLASNTKLFTIHVSFTGENAVGDITYKVGDGEERTLSLASGSATADIELSNGMSCVFTNIPAGVTYTVEEDSKHLAKDGEDITTSEEGYSVSYEVTDGTIAAGDKDTVVVNNEKKTEIQTGISLDSLPYILIGVAVLAALVVMILRRRRAQED